MAAEQTFAEHAFAEESTCRELAIQMKSWNRGRNTKTPFSTIPRCRPRYIAVTYFLTDPTPHLRNKIRGGCASHILKEFIAMYICIYIYIYLFTVYTSKGVGPCHMAGSTSVLFEKEGDEAEIPFLAQHVIWKSSFDSSDGWSVAKGELLGSRQKSRRC